MICPSTERLAHYQLDACSAHEAAAIAQHLTGCSRCRAELAALTRVGDLLATLPASPPPPDLWPAVAARMHARKAARRWWAVLAPAGALAVLLLGMLFRQQTPALPAASASASSYVVSHQVLATENLLTDRASLGAALASYEEEHP